MNTTVNRMFFKAFPFLILSIISHSAVTAQPDTPGTEADSGAAYLSPMEYAFMMHEEPKFMVRLPFTGAGAEVELLPHFTFMAQVRFGTGLPYVVDSELRWYYGGKKRGMRNMSGNYIAAGMQIFNEGLFYSSEHGHGLWTTDFGGYYRMLGYVRWGMQRRMLGNGLIDMGLLAGYQPFISSGHENADRADYSAIRLSATATLGLGLVFGNRKELDWQRLCPVTKCYDVERSMLKVKFSNTVNYWYFPGQGQHLLWLNPAIAYEHKILQSSFSVNANAHYNFSLSGIDISGAESQSYRHNLNLRLEGRWYYNMKRRMLRGKGGNGLSGNYIAAGARQQHFEDSPSAHFGKVDPYIVTGIQRTLGKRFYFDVNAGITRLSESGPDMRRIWPIWDMQIGFRF